MAPRASGDPHVGITLAMSVITVDHFAGVATLAGKALKGKERTVNPANPKPYLSLRVELKDLGVCVVIDPNRLNSPQISTTPRDFLNSLARAIGALVETRHTCDKWRRLQDREIVIALPIDLWILANSTTTGDDGRTIAQALVDLFPGLTIVSEVDREPVLANLAAEVKGLRSALLTSRDRIRELEKNLAEMAALYNASRGLGPVNPERSPGDVAFDPKTGKDRRLIRRAQVGIFGGCEIWAVQDCVAHAGSPVPWDTARVFPWVVHVDTVVPCRETGRPIKVTFSMPASGPPGSPEWQVAELAAVKRAGIHEAMESFGFDPHEAGGDSETLEAALDCGPDPGETTAEIAREVKTMVEGFENRVNRLHADANDARRGLEAALKRMGLAPGPTNSLTTLANTIAGQVEIKFGETQEDIAAYKRVIDAVRGALEIRVQEDIVERAKAIAAELARHRGTVDGPIAMLHDAIDEIAARYKDRGIVGLRVLHRGREIELQVREPAEPPWIAFINPTDGDGFATDEDTIEGEGLGVFDALDAVSDKADAAEALEENGITCWKCSHEYVPEGGEGDPEDRCPKCQASQHECEFCDGLGGEQCITCGQWVCEICGPGHTDERAELACPRGQGDDRHPASRVDVTAGRDDEEGEG